ncbi:hypothetical protein [Haloarchaeobius amylolyticus]|uniref:hypothetical protein n=1 Tax=Haloarchaeobius amylolyticus TaxID=1198296 RepID=UPI00226EC18F|nr:hypothetical protein [Haloarchaeobius amylolyticus]
MQRRQVLAAAGAALSAGCLSEAFGDGETPARDCQVMKSSLSAEAVSPTADQREQLVPVVLSEQDAGVQSVFQAVIEGQELTTCPKKTVTAEPEKWLGDALQVVEDAHQRQQENYEGDAPDWVDRTAYLRREDEYYALSARLSDLQLSYPTDLP